MAVLSDEAKQRVTGIMVAIGLLIVVFGFSILLSLPSNQVSRSNPVWFVGMLIIFGAALALIAVVFKWLGLANPAEAFGLPTGSVRALLAVAVMVLFAVFGLAAIVNDDSAPKRPSERPLGAAEVATAAADKEIQRYQAMNIAAIRVSSDADVTRLQLYRLEQARPTETVDLMKQIVTALVTLVTSVVSFYFGSRSVETSRDGRQGAPSTSPPESTSEDIKRIDAELEDASQRLATLQGEEAAAGNEAALVANLSRLSEAIAAAKAGRVKLEARLKDLASGAATTETVTAETDALKESLRQVEALVELSEALVAKG